MLQRNPYLTTTVTLLSAAYGTGTYGCGAYEVGCNTTGTGILPPDTSAILSEPSVVVPGSLLLAILVALITTTVVKLLRRRHVKKYSDS
jgi:hypothetical protein